MGIVGAGIVGAGAVTGAAVGCVGAPGFPPTGVGGCCMPGGGIVGCAWGCSPCARRMFKNAAGFDGVTLHLRDLQERERGRRAIPW